MLEGLAFVASRRLLDRFFWIALPAECGLSLELCNTTDWITKVRRPNGAIASEQANTLEFDDIWLDTDRYSHSRRNGCRPLSWA
jgi:hypothetical protein